MKIPGMYSKHNVILFHVTTWTLRGGSGVLLSLGKQMFMLKSVFER